MNTLAQRWAGTVAAVAFLIVASAPGAARANPFDQTVMPIEIGDQMPATRFIDQHGQPVSFATLRGQAVAVGFIYTACRDACPITTQKFMHLNGMLAAGRYRLVEVTIDPVHDTPGVMAAYARRYGVTGPRWQLLTGEPRTLETFARSAGISVIDNGHGELVHNSRLLIVAPDGRLADIVQLVAWDPATVAAQLQYLAGAPSSGLARANFALTKTIAQFCGGSYQVASGIIDVVASALLVGVGLWVALWIRRRLFAQGA